MESQGSLSHLVAQFLLWALVVLLVFIVIRSARFFGSLLLLPMARLLRMFPPLRRRMDAYVARKLAEWEGGR